MAKHAQSDRAFEDLVARSGFIFIGAAVGRHPAASGLRVASDRTVVVRVHDVLRAPRVLGDLTDKEVIVHLAKGKGTTRGERHVFFTTSWLFGDTLAVAEVTRMKPQDEFQRRITNAERRLQDRALLERIDKASLIVTGKVARTRPTDKQPRFVSEHDPKWHEALVEVESVEKGRLTGRTVVVLFPSSTDELWIESPKFHEGQDGLWILQRNQQERGAPVFRVPGYTALDPLDYHPRDRRDRVLKLLKTSR